MSKFYTCPNGKAYNNEKFLLIKMHISANGKANNNHYSTSSKSILVYLERDTTIKIPHL